MNFLGHLLVSGTEPLTIVGNFMADGVKGRDLSRYGKKLQEGIRMHRHIDTFTDNHALTLQGRERLRDHCGKYAGVALDLFYDHAIASNWDSIHAEHLPRFEQRMYALLNANAHLMPERAQRMLPYMVRDKWLSSYATYAGIGHALLGLSSRVPGGQVLAGAESILKEHEAEFEDECLRFIPLLKNHLSQLHALA